MALTTSRMSVLRGRPPGLAGGISGTIRFHCESVTSVGYRFRAFMTVKYEVSETTKRPLFKHVLSSIVTSSQVRSEIRLIHSEWPVYFPTVYFQLAMRPLIVIHVEQIDVAKEHLFTRLISAL